MTPTEADPVTPSLVAMMLALPAPIAVTSPVLLTVATAVFEVLQLTVGPVNEFPLASFSTAVAWILVPICAVGALNETTIEATDTGVSIGPPFV
jgi:hypothetical protein